VTRRQTRDERVELALRRLVATAGQLVAMSIGATAYLPSQADGLAASRRGTRRAVERAKYLLLELDCEREIANEQATATPAGGAAKGDE
jgi:hypothetical protein